MDYWIECISIALEEVGLSATEEQIRDIAGAVEGAHENYGMAFGYDAIPNPLQEENRTLRAEIKEEREQAHGIMADCYGALGALDAEVAQLRDALKEIAELGSFYAVVPEKIRIARKALGCKRMPY